MGEARSGCRAAIALGALLAGCGRLDFDDVAAQSDAGHDAITSVPFTLPLTGLSYGRGVAILPDGGAVVVGTATGPLQLGSFMLPGDGAQDVLITSIGPDGTVRWAKLMGSPGLDMANSVATAADGSIFVTGVIGGPVDFGGGALASNHDDAFVASYTADGTHRWSFSFGGGSIGAITDLGASVALAPDGDVLVGGSVSGTVDFGDGAMTTGTGATYEGFVARYGPAGTPLRWARRLGTAGENQACAVTAAADNSVYAAGFYSGSPDLGGGPLPNRGADDGLVLALTATGGFRWAQTYGATNNDRLYGIAMDGATVVAGGYYWNNPNVPGVPAPHGQSEGIVIAYDTSGALAWATGYGGTGCDFVSSVHAASNGVMIGGTFGGTVDFGAGARTSVGSDTVLFEMSAGTVTWSTSFDLGGDDLGADAAGDPPSGMYVVGVDNAGFDSGCYETSVTGFIRHL